MKNLIFAVLFAALSASSQAQSVAVQQETCAGASWIQQYLPVPPVCTPWVWVSVHGDSWDVAGYDIYLFYRDAEGHEQYVTAYAEAQYGSANCLFWRIPGTIINVIAIPHFMYYDIGYWGGFN